MEGLSPKGFLEKARLGLSMANIGHEQEMRLSCQCKVIGDVTIETQPGLNLSGDNFWARPYPNK
jgi:ferredoxin